MARVPSITWGDKIGAGVSSVARLELFNEERRIEASPVLN